MRAHYAGLYYTAVSSRLTAEELAYIIEDSGSRAYLTSPYMSEAAAEFDASEGQGKEKSEAHHNRERLNLVSWATLVFLTSNTHMQDYMSGARQHTSQSSM